MFGKLSSMFASVKEAGFTLQARFQNAVFMAGMVGICARMSAADGEIEKEEQEKMFKFMSVHPAMKVFTATEVLKAWNDLMAFYDISKELGDSEANKMIAKLAADGEQAETAVQLGLAIANADGEFEPEEVETIKQIVVTLGLRAADFGL